MKRLTLDETWTLCLKMWKWIAEQRKKNDSTNITILKDDWLIKHGYGNKRILEDCFFCEYTASHNIGCCECPAKKINSRFSCMNISYHYRSKPIAFYAKLVELNKKRKQKKRAAVKTELK